MTRRRNTNVSPSPLEMGEHDLNASVHKKKLQKKCNLSYGVRILSFLKKNAPSEFNIKTIADTLDIPYNAAKTELYRLFNRGKIKRPHRGFYRAVIDKNLVHKLGNPPIELHGIKIEAKSQKLIQGIPNVAQRKLSALDFSKTTNGRYHRNIYFKGRKITITIHMCGLIEIWVSCSDNPLDYLLFRELLSYLNGFLESVLPAVDRKVVLKNSYLKQIGLNRDYDSFRLDGLSCVSLKAFIISGSCVKSSSLPSLTSFLFTNG